MPLATLANILKSFGGARLSPEESAELRKEALLMTLARATKSDSNIAPVEISTVQRVIYELTGDEISEADIRVAASSELFETTSLEKALAAVAKDLSIEHRVRVTKALAEVLRSDLRITEHELDYFDSVVNALGVRPAELAGLIRA